ncbi:MAG: hypothetical protein Phog2KO_49700 [Phototrophicaceae bacterium]
MSENQTLQIKFSSSEIYTFIQIPVKNGKYKWLHPDLVVRLYPSSDCIVTNVLTYNSIDNTTVGSSKGLSGSVNMSADLFAVGSLGAEFGGNKSIELSRPSMQFSPIAETKQGERFYQASIPIDILPKPQKDMKAIYFLFCWLVDTGDVESIDIEAGGIKGDQFTPEYKRINVPKQATNTINNAPEIQELPDMDVEPLEERHSRKPSSTSLFISYRHGMDGLARLTSSLNKHRYPVWLDSNELRSGEPDWMQAIVRAIQNCAGVILCLTKDAAFRPVIRWEIRHAVRFEKPIFPVIMEKMSDKEIETSLKELNLPRIQYEDLSKQDNWDQQFTRLMEGMSNQGIRVSRHSKHVQLDPEEVTIPD